MQVSHIEAAPGAGSGKEATKPSQAASDAFAILLQNALTQNPAISTVRTHGERSLADHFSADSQPGAEAPPAAARDDIDSGAADVPATPEDHDDESVARPEANANSENATDRLAALTNATEAQISLSRTQANVAAAAQQDKTALQSAIPAKTAAADGNLTAAGAQAAPNTQEPKTPANSTLKPGGDPGANAGRATAQVIDGGQALVSRPGNTLSAAATLSAQTGAQEKQTAIPHHGSANAESADKAQKSGQATTGESSRNSGNTRLAENSGNLLLNAGDAKNATANAGRTGQPATQQAQTALNGAANTAPALQQAAAPVQPAPAQPLQSAANGRPAPAAERAPSLPVTDSAPTVGAGQAGAQSTASTARVASPVPARPATPPSDLKEQISIQVQKAVEQGVDRIRIQLKPADLGRLEIRLDIAQDGKVAIVVNADRPETLEMLRRDARGLQQALQDAGLQTDSGGLSFNLGGGNASFGDQLADGGRPGNGSDANSVKVDENSEATEANHHRRSSNSKIDVEV